MTLISRRQFFARAGALITLVAVPTSARASTRASGRSPHPTPRPGITSAKVATRAQLADAPKAIAVFDQVREIPQIIDGIRCQCGCTDGKSYYSLLSCYEAPDMMAKICEICQAQGRLAYRLNKAGKSLDEIRRGIEARFN